MSEITHILRLSGAGSRPRAGNLLPLVYDELRSLAARKLAKERPGHTLQATALVHEAWLRLGGDESQGWNDRAHFFRTAAQAMRRILVDRAREKSAQKRGGGMLLVENLGGLPVAAVDQDERILLVDEALDRLEREDPDSARVVSLKFFGGLTNREVAAMDGVTERTIERQWAYAKARLFRMIQDES